MDKRGRNYTEEILKILDLASRITVFFYALLIDISVFERVFKFTGNQSFLGYLFLAVGAGIFILHRTLQPGKRKTSDLLHSFFYNLLLSFALALFLLSFVSPYFKELLGESSVFFSGMGKIMLMYTTVFIYVLLLTIAERLLKRNTNILISIGVIIFLFLVFMFGMNQINRSEAAGSVGLFLLGPVNLLIVNILFFDGNNWKVKKNS